MLEEVCFAKYFRYKTVSIFSTLFFLWHKWMVFLSRLLHAFVWWNNSSLKRKANASTLHFGGKCFLCRPSANRGIIGAVWRKVMVPQVLPETRACTYQTWIKIYTSMLLRWLLNRFHIYIYRCNETWMLFCKYFKW